MPEFPTREELIDLCTRGVVPQEHWYNRDTAGAQRQLGEALALLKAGCDFHEEVSHYMKSDSNTIWVRIEFPGFNAFEYGPADRSTWESETFYIPTADRLYEAKGKDWY